MLANPDHEYGLKIHLRELKKDDLSFLPEWIATFILNYQKSIIESTLTNYIFSVIKKGYPILEKSPIFTLFKKSLNRGIPVGQTFVATFNRMTQDSPLSGVCQTIKVSSLSVFASVITPNIKIRFKKIEQDNNTLNIVQFFHGFSESDSKDF